MNGTSTDGDKLLANFNANLNQAGTFNISETIMDRSEMKIIDEDFELFRTQAKNMMNNEGE